MSAKILDLDLKRLKKNLALLDARFAKTPFIGKKLEEPQVEIRYKSEGYILAEPMSPFYFLHPPKPGR